MKKPETLTKTNISIPTEAIPALLDWLKDWEYEIENGIDGYAPLQPLVQALKEVSHA